MEKQLRWDLMGRIIRDDLRQERLIHCLALYHLVDKIIHRGTHYYHTSSGSFELRDLLINSDFDRNHYLPIVIPIYNILMAVSKIRVQST